MTRQIETLKSLFTDPEWLCGYCNKDCYGGNCKTLRKAKELTDQQWLDIANTYPFESVDDIDVFSVVEAITTKWNNKNAGYRRL